MLWLAGTLPDFIRVYLGDIRLVIVLEDRIEALGESAAPKAFSDWLNLGPLTRVASRRT